MRNPCVMVVCHCKAVNDAVIREALDGGSITVHDVMSACGAGTHCGGCLDTLRSLVAGSGGAGRAAQVTIG